MKGLLFLCLLACKCQIALCDGFSDDASRNYLILTVDEANDQLIVGGKDKMWRLGLDSLNVLEGVIWATNNTDYCEHHQLHNDKCHNFIRILELANGGSKVLTCGTYSFAPKCAFRNPTNLSQVMGTPSWNGDIVLQKYDGAGICPYSPDVNFTAVMTSQSGVFVGTAWGFLSRNKGILRQKVGSTSLPPLTTMRADITWLDEPNFVSSYEIGNYVYFFLREVAVEVINCEKRIYSRVARVCKSDMGGRLHDDNWMSFRKARLNCSFSGEYPFYFDHLRSTYYARDEGLIYGVFTTPPNAPAGSAICVYTVSNIESAFDGPIKYQESPISAWLRRPNRNTYRCTGSRSSGNASNEENNLQYHLMDNAVQPRTPNPIAWFPNERWSHIVVDTVRTKFGNYSVLFIANGKGVIYKLVHLPQKKKMCMLYKINDIGNPGDKVVNDLKISRSRGEIYVSIGSTVQKRSVDRCSNINNAVKCQSAKSPYCGWDRSRRRCSRPQNNNPNVRSFRQTRIVNCLGEAPHIGRPRPHRQKRGAEAQKANKTPVNGNWSKWSGWKKCSIRGQDNTANHCLCRTTRNQSTMALTVKTRGCRSPTAQ